MFLLISRVAKLKHLFCFPPPLPSTVEAAPIPDSFFVQAQAATQLSLNSDPYL
jgi:hypothetical protein